MRVRWSLVPKGALAAVMAVLAVLALIVVPGGGANAATDDDGLWYVDQMGVRDAWAQGIDGSGVTIADLDTAINTDVPWLQGADVSSPMLANKCEGSDEKIPAESTDFEVANHATDMVSLLVGNGQGATSGQAALGVAPQAKVLHYAVGSEDAGWGCPADFGAVLMQALDAGADVIVMPVVASGINNIDFTEGDGSTAAALYEAVRRGVPVFAGRMNTQSALTDGKYALDVTGVPSISTDYSPGLVTVQAIDSSGDIQAESRVLDHGVDLVGPGVGVTNQRGDWGRFQTAVSGGTSSATTLAGGYLALARQKWPDATGNQLLQLMVRTTGLNKDSFDAPQRDPEGFYGWGIPSLQRMLATDPSSLPDVNPALQSDIETAQKDAEALGGESAFGGVTADRTKGSGLYLQLLDTQQGNGASPAPGAGDSSSASGTHRGVASPLLWSLGIAAASIIVIVAIVLVVRSRRRARPVGTPVPPVPMQPAPQGYSSGPAPDSIPSGPPPRVRRAEDTGPRRNDRNG